MKIRLKDISYKEMRPMLRVPVNMLPKGFVVPLWACICCKFCNWDEMDFKLYNNMVLNHVKEAHPFEWSVLEHRKGGIYRIL